MRLEGWRWLAAGALLTAPGPAFGGDAPPDTSGSGLVEWAYDQWTVPWVQVAGGAPTLAPTSHATLMALACATANLERDRLARHLSREDCEHRMAEIRSDQDSAIIFRLDLRAFSFPGSAGIVRLDSRTKLTLEDDRGRRWSPVEVRRGPAVIASSGFKLQRYYPAWTRGAPHAAPYPYDVTSRRDLTIAEHVVRFVRRDPQWGDPIIGKETRWISLRLSGPRHEWVATWTFRQTGEAQP